MSAVIYKWPIPVDDVSHAVPWQPGAVATHVQVRPDPAIVDLWVHYEDRGLITDEIAVRVVGTGHLFSPHAVVLGTTVHPDHPLVWHVIQEDAR